MTAMLNPLQPACQGSSPGNVEHIPVIAASNESAAKALTKAVLAGERFIALIGEPGVGRSAIVDALVIGRAHACIHVVRVRNSAPGPLGVGRLVVLILGGQHTHGVEDGLQRVLQVLTAQVHQGKRLVLVIEDADKLERPALEMLKLLPDVHRGGSPHAQILLVGRAGFWTLLAGRSQDPHGKIAASIGPTPPTARSAEEPNSDHGVGTDEYLPPLSSIRSRGTRRASWFLPRARRRPAGLALLAIASGMAALTLVAYHSVGRYFPVHPGASRQEAARRAAWAEPRPTTPGGSAAAIGSPGAGSIPSRIRTSGLDEMPAAPSEQQAVRSAFPAAPAGSAIAAGSTTRTPQMRAGLEVLQADTMNRVEAGSPESVIRSQLSNRNRNIGSPELEGLDLQKEQDRRQRERAVSSFPGASSRERSLLPAELVSFRGPINNETMRRAGQLSLVIKSHGSPGSIRAQFDAREGLLGSGELAGILSEDGRISASGQLMMGKNPFVCELSGLISGDKLIGSANFVRSSGGRVAHSSFTLTRS